ncbi:MAG: hypothetical protein RLZZ501_532 [Pseudomonadota bacterium]|jgi:uncharacterized membrane-anchored protein
MAEALPLRPVALREHPQRRVLAGEIHARPFDLLEAPLRVSHLSLVHADPGAERAHLAELLAAHGAEVMAADCNFFSRELGGFRLRWERHSEFSTYTVSRGDSFVNPFEASALELLPLGWLENLPGEMLSAIHVAVAHEVPEDLSALFGGNPLVGSKVVGGHAEIWTDFRLHNDGFGRVLVRDGDLTAGQTGRLVQRMLEIDTYRMMALLAFPLARYANNETGRIDRALADIVTQLADPQGTQNDRELLDRLTRLAAEAEQLDATTSFRLAAAKAYFNIVNSRVYELREDRIFGLQTIAEFTERRLVPAMKTCEAAARRQQSLATRVSRAGDLLRTRVDIALEEKNRDLLRSMNRRAEIQVRLQQTVEGLSVVAITYYLLGVIGYLARGLIQLGLPIHHDVVELIAVPTVAGAVWLGVRRLRKALIGASRE